MGSDEYHVIAHLLEGQAGLLCKTLYTRQFLGEEASIDHDHRDDLKFGCH
jgi:hypothetical protein